jgi:acyl-CoA reductase-like NAD-dependent aldehyde dehydrogenase
MRVRELKHAFPALNQADLLFSPLRVTSASAEDVTYAIRKAQDAFESGVWSKAPALTRSKVLSKLARLLEEMIPEMAKIETMQTGRTIREMNAQLGRLPEWL